MTKSQTHQEEMLSKEGTQSYQIVKNSLNETPKPPEERVTSENHPTTPTPGLHLNQTIPTNILQDTFYGTRVVVLVKSDFADEIICDVRTNVRHLSEVCENDELNEGVIVEIKGKSYRWVEGEYENDIIFDRKLVEEVFHKIDSQATDSRIKRITCELDEKRNKLLRETDEMRKLEDELKWLQHEQEKQIPEDVTDQIIGE